MTSEDLKALQAPLKVLYRDEPARAQHVLSASGVLNLDEVACRVETHLGLVEAGLHPATGGEGKLACSADMLLQSLVACAGVTLAAVAKALGLNIRSGRVFAEGNLDFRGTLGVSRDVTVGFSAIRLRFELDTDATEEQRSTLIRLTERYCVIYQTLQNPARLDTLIDIIQSS